MSRSTAPAERSLLAVDLMFLQLHTITHRPRFSAHAHHRSPIITVPQPRQPPDHRPQPHTQRIAANFGVDALGTQISESDADMVLDALSADRVQVTVPERTTAQHPGIP